MSALDATGPAHDLGPGPDVPSPDAAEIRDNATFAAVLEALSRPGSVQRLPEPGPAPLALALIDRECRVWAADPALAELLARTGATPVPPELADHVFAPLDDAAAVDRLSRLTCGDPLYPDTGATVIAPARIGSGPALQLKGPGILGALNLRLGGLHPSVWRVRAGLCRYPLGIEMILHDGDRIVAIPRSTLIEEI